MPAPKSKAKSAEAETPVVETKETPVMETPEVTKEEPKVEAPVKDEPSKVEAEASTDEKKPGKVTVYGVSETDASKKKAEETAKAREQAIAEGQDPANIKDTKAHIKISLPDDKVGFAYVNRDQLQVKEHVQEDGSVRTSTNVVYDADKRVKLDVYQKDENGRIPKGAEKNVEFKNPYVLAKEHNEARAQYSDKIASVQQTAENIKEPVAESQAQKE